MGDLREIAKRVKREIETHDETGRDRLQYADVDDLATFSLAVLAAVDASKERRYSNEYVGVKVLEAIEAARD